jgi:hypothetical protein
MIFSPAARKHIFDYLQRDIKLYPKGVYCYGKIRFNFQIASTLNWKKPFTQEPLFTQENMGYENELADFLVGVNTELSTAAGRLLVLRGATGSGKTTALEQAIDIATLKVKAANPERQFEILHININNISSLEGKAIAEISEHVWTEYAVCIDKQLAIMGTSESIAEQWLFYGWLKGQSSFIQKIPNIYRFFEKNREFLEGVKEKSGYAKYNVDELKEIIINDWRATVEKMSVEEICKYKVALFRYALTDRKDNKLVHAIIIDNIDHISPELQHIVVENSIWLSDCLDFRTIIAVRPLTWENQKGHRSFSVQEHLSPSLADVLCNRLTHIVKMHDGESDVRDSAQWIMDEVKNERSHFRNVVYATSGVSVRAMLRGTLNFLSSPLLDRGGTSTRDEVRPSDIARAYFFGSEQSIEHSNIDDIYSVDNVRNERIALLKPRLIDYVIRVRGGRVSVSEIFPFIRRFGYSDIEINSALRELMIRKRALLWCNSTKRITVGAIDDNEAIIAIAPLGASYYARLFGEYLYTEVCLAIDRDHIVRSEDIINFSKNLIVEDERQIAEFVAISSQSDYYAAYGIEYPSITHIYWSKFVDGVKGRTLTWKIDIGWNNRIRHFLYRHTGYNYK